MNEYERAEHGVHTETDAELAYVHRDHGFLRVVALTPASAQRVKLPCAVMVSVTDHVPRVFQLCFVLLFGTVSHYNKSVD